MSEAEGGDLLIRLKATIKPLLSASVNGAVTPGVALGRLAAFYQALAQVLCHGLRRRRSVWRLLHSVQEGDPTLADILLKVRQLKSVRTASGRVQVVFRHCLNQGCLGDVLERVLANADVLQDAYEEYAVARSLEHSMMLKALLVGLQAVHFILPVDGFDVTETGDDGSLDESGDGDASDDDGSVASLHADNVATPRTAGGSVLTPRVGHPTPIPGDGDAGSSCSNTNNNGSLDRGGGSGGGAASDARSDGATGPAAALLRWASSLTSPGSGSRSTAAAAGSPSAVETAVPPAQVSVTAETAISPRRGKHDKKHVAEIEEEAPVRSTSEFSLESLLDRYSLTRRKEKEKEKEKEKKEKKEETAPAMDRDADASIDAAEAAVAAVASSPTSGLVHIGLKAADVAKAQAPQPQLKPYEKKLMQLNKQRSESTIEAAASSLSRTSSVLDLQSMAGGASSPSAAVRSPAVAPSAEPSSSPVFAVPAPALASTAAKHESPTTTATVLSSWPVSTSPALASTAAKHESMIAVATSTSPTSSTELASQPEEPAPPRPRHANGSGEQRRPLVPLDRVPALSERLEEPSPFIEMRSPAVQVRSTTVPEVDARTPVLPSMRWGATAAPHPTPTLRRPAAASSAYGSSSSSSSSSDAGVQLGAAVATKRDDEVDDDDEVDEIDDALKQALAVTDAPDAVAAIVADAPQEPLDVLTKVRDKLHDVQHQQALEPVFHAPRVVLDDQVVQRVRDNATATTTRPDNPPVAAPAAESSPAAPGKQAASTTTTTTRPVVQLAGAGAVVTVRDDVPERESLASQGGVCAECGAGLSASLLASPDWCNYTGLYYCDECFGTGRALIPGRLIHNWDISLYPVCRAAFIFLKTTLRQPVYDIAQVAPELYDKVPEMQAVRLLRRQLNCIREYILTCRERDRLLRLVRPGREHLFRDLDSYSVDDLVHARNGDLAKSLSSLFNALLEHVEACELCRAKGFICEFCRGDKPLYPFQLLSTVSCPRCRTLVHRKCLVPGKCPKCARIARRKSVQREVS